MKKIKLLSILAIIVLSGSFKIQAQQHVWRVNNNPAYQNYVPGSNQVFTDLPEAVENVPDGDTLYVEASSTVYSAATITQKKLTIIGAGYLLNQNDGLQNNEFSSKIVSLAFGPNSNGSKVSGLETAGGNGSQFLFTNNPLANITISKCKGHVHFVNTAQQDSIVISKGYMSFDIGFSHVTRLYITNNFIVGNLSIELYAQGTATQNVVQGDVNISGFKFYNNIVLGNQIYENNNSTSNVYNNLYDFSPSPAWLSGGAGGNIFGLQQANIFSNLLTSDDGKYKINPGCVPCFSGFPTNTNAEIGMYGGADPYHLSGIPNIPSISKLQSQLLVSPNMTTPVIISTRTNN